MIADHLEEVGEKVRGKLGKAGKRGDSSARCAGALGVTIKLFGATTEKLRKLEREANPDAARRVKLADIVSLGLSRITSEDLEALRKDKATVEDKYKERLVAFQYGNPSATEEDFKEHLLNLLEEANVQTKS